MTTSKLNKAKTLLKKRNRKTYTFLIPHSLDRKIRIHIKENKYDSLAEFIRTAIGEQLSLEGPVSFPLPIQRQRMINFFLPPALKKQITISTARTNYSSVSDFIRISIRNKLVKETKHS